MARSQVRLPHPLLEETPLQSHCPNLLRNSLLWIASLLEEALDKPKVEDYLPESLFGGINLLSLEPDLLGMPEA